MSNLSGKELKGLLGSEITSAQPMRRPLDGWSKQVGPLSHSGMLVETKNPVGGTNQWLVHKGKGFGSSTNTVVTKAENMSSKWTPHGPKQSGGGSTVSNYVQKGGTKYNFVTDNCHDAVNRMKKK